MKLSDCKFADKALVRGLASVTNGPCVTILLPTHRALRGARSGGVRLVKLLATAREGLCDAGLSGPSADLLLAPARELVTDESFWLHQDRGLAIYLSGERRELVHLELSPGELVYVGERFLLRPLLSAYDEDATAYVVAVSLKSSRLFRVSRHAILEVASDAMPQGLLALAEDEHSHTLQFFSGPSQQRGAYGRAASGKQRGAGKAWSAANVVKSFGQGYGTDARKENAERYLRLVSDAVSAAIVEAEPLLVVAGVGYVGAMLGGMLRKGRVVGTVIGNPDTMSLHELRTRAWHALDAYFDERAQGRSHELEDAEAVARATLELEDVLRAAYDGRITSLLVAPDVERWGRFEPETRRLVLHERPVPGDDELVELALLHTLRNGGEIAVRRHEPGGETGALLRY